MSDTSPGDETQAEIRQQAADSPVDPESERERLEQDLMEEGRSEEGSRIGDESP